MTCAFRLHPIDVLLPAPRTTLLRSALRIAALCQGSLDTLACERRQKEYNEAMAQHHRTRLVSIGILTKVRIDLGVLPRIKRYVVS